ncbi:MAG: DUF5723 family protein [Cytophagaceae bacterium]|nr:DUF5723 family protein [Cytophagaceae bacterium]MDW8457078.1 DUF5723 family protein [Cytophagaceae bacterium]
MKLKYIFIAVLMVSVARQSVGQHELTLFHMNNVFQGTYVNPTLMPEHKVSLGLPGMSSVYFMLNNSTWRANDFKKKINDDSVIFNLEGAVNKLDNKNYVNTAFSTDLFSLRIKIRNTFASINVTEQVDFRLNYPKDLFKLINQGNAQFVGEAADFSGLRVNSSHYREYALGLARIRDGAKFSYGVRLKLLQGLNNVKTVKSDARISIDEQYYAHTLKASAQVNSSTIANDTTGNEDYVKALTSFDNMGWGLDLGATYHVNHRLSFTGSLVNLGAITWKSNVVNRSIDGEYTFSGIKLDLQNDSIKVDIDAVLDSLKSAFKIKETYNQSYKTSLPPRMYLSMGYMLGRNTKVALTFYNEFYQGMNPAISAAYVQRAGRILNFLFTYTAKKNSFNNVGAGLMLKLIAMQIYMVGDNMLAIANPFNATNFNLRFGINLVFGRIRKPDEQSHNEE